MDVTWRRDIVQRNSEHTRDIYNDLYPLLVQACITGPTLWLRFFIGAPQIRAHVHVMRQGSGNQRMQKDDTL